MSRELYQSVTDSIIAELEKGAAPWIKPWRADSSADRNMITGRPYQGINRLIFGLSSMMKGYSAPVWASYQQWQALGAQVKEGERATRGVYFQPVVKKTNKATGETDTYTLLKSFTVFNVEQVTGIEYVPAVVPQLTDFQRHERAEATIAATGAVISYGGDAAFYAPSLDRIQMPNRSAFDAESSYYATIFHELTHWTGDKSRCDRDKSGNRFGNPAYAFEELVAELGAAFLCADHGIAGELRHAGYIGNWLKACREDNRAIFRAAALAQRAADFILASGKTEAVAA